jgi:hypothetical protein
MKPIERAMQVYQLEPCARTFGEDLRLHLLNGYVFNTPTMFLMGRPVSSDAAPRLIVDPAVSFDRPDAWLVYLLAGDLREALDFIPYPLEKICLERLNKLRFYGFEYLTRRIRARFSHEKQVTHP